MRAIGSLAAICRTRSTLLDPVNVTWCGCVLVAVAAAGTRLNDAKKDNTGEAYKRSNIQRRARQHLAPKMIKTVPG